MKTRDKSSDWSVGETFLIVVFTGARLMRCELGEQRVKGQHQEGKHGA